MIYFERWEFRICDFYLSSGLSPTQYQYTGQYSHTADFGLMFYNARWYDPALGRFAQADSIVPGGAQGLDRYAYVNNNPMRYTDPTGHRNCEEDGYHCAGWDYKPAKPTATATPTPISTPSPVATLYTIRTSRPAMTPTMTPTIIPTVKRTVTPTLRSTPQANINPTPNGGIPYVGPPPSIAPVFIGLVDIYKGAIEGFVQGGDGAPGFVEVFGPAAAPLDVVLSLPQVWEKLNYVPSHGSSFVPAPVSTPYIAKPPIPISVPTP